MTLGAHEIPVLIELCPMQHVVVADFFIGIEMEPPLPAPFLCARVPGDRKSLHAAVRKLDQILLQRIDAESVLHLESGELSVWSIRLDKILAILTEETRADAVIVERRVAEVAEH